ncbi:MAG TPA: Hpt domain-containing protein [Terracidiphilus sp.]|nr:Hpt domain-containing protein [Terracidiphilus sp.]
MKTDAQPGQNANPKLTAALDLLWMRFLPEIRERVAILESAAAACAANQLTKEQLDMANSAAHKLAGALGTFSLARGTDLAREFEFLSSRETPPEPDLANRLGSIAAELRVVIDSRK